MHQFDAVGEGGQLVVREHGKHRGVFKQAFEFGQIHCNRHLRALAEAGMGMLAMSLD